MTIFDKAVEFTLSSEGVFSNDAADRGGKTKYGITEDELIRYQQQTGRLKGMNIRDLPKSEAIEIYRVNYWRFDGISSAMIAIKFFDMAVNFGPGAATGVVQKALQFVGVPVKVDNAYGKQTEAAINEFTGRGSKEALQLFKAIVLFQASRYVQIVLGNSSQLDFINGWIIRAGKRPT